MKSYHFSELLELLLVSRQTVLPRLCQPWIPQARLTQPWHELISAGRKRQNRYMKSSFRRAVSPAPCSWTILGQQQSNR